MAKDLEVEVDLSQLKQLPDQAEKVGDNALNYYTQDLLGQAKEEAPVGKTGRLRQEMEMGRKDSTTYYIGSDVFYRWWVHSGTGIYGETGQRITPVTAKFLRFEWNGQIIYAKSVAGQEANPYYERAIESMESKGEEYIKRALEELDLT